MAERPEDTERAGAPTTEIMDATAGIPSPVEELMPLPASLRPAEAGEHDSAPHPVAPADGSDTSRSATRPRSARLGDVIGGRYVVDGNIGRGGMGRVLRVRHQVLGKAFALKLIRSRRAADPRIAEMFYREARLASSLAHDSICSIVDFGNDPACGLFMVMELLEGASLHDKLRDDGPMTIKAACTVLWQIADAVRYIHSRSIVHGDLKSENILLVHGAHPRRVKLLDFGLARVDIRGTSSTLEGTPEYMAPECVQGQAASARSDIYALGILFHELLVGRPPFQGTLEAVLRMQVEEPTPRLVDRLGEAADPRADELLARATAKDPAERHADAGSFLYELQTLMHMLGMDSRRRRPPEASSGSSRRRGRTALRRTQGAAEVFDHAPIPLAAVDSAGKVRVANEAFLEFLGVAGDAAGIELADSHLPEVYPTLFDDLTLVATSRATLKRVIELRDRREGDTVQVAVILAAVPADAAVTAGDVHMTLHPLGRAPSRR